MYSLQLYKDQYMQITKTIQDLKLQLHHENHPHLPIQQFHLEKLLRKMDCNINFLLILYNLQHKMNRRLHIHHTHHSQLLNHKHYHNQMDQQHRNHNQDLKQNHYTLLRNQVFQHNHLHHHIYHRYLHHHKH